MKIPKYLSILSLVVIGVLYGASPAWAAGILGTAQSFAVLGASTVTNTGSTVIYGDLGLSPGTSVTGFPPGIMNGTIYTGPGPGPAQTAQADATTAYNTLLHLAPTSTLTGQDLGGKTLTPGVYNFSSSAQLTGPLTLDFGGNANALFVFQIGSTLTTASGAVVNVTNGGTNDGVFWQVGSSATLGTSTQFAGNILAYSSITLDTSANILCGRAIALTGAVTMDTNTISNNCSTYGGGFSDFGSGGFSGGQTAPVSAVPEPKTYAMLLAGLGLLGFTTWRRKDLTA